jgi:squalene cyclase
MAGALAASGAAAAQGVATEGAVAPEPAPRPDPPPGVTPAVERAIEKGLAFLAREQRPDGSYSKSVYSPQLAVYPTAMTSLAGLAFLASGSTPTRGPYARHLQKITAYLLENCLDNDSYAPGLIANRRALEQRPMYCHAFAMTYLAQVYGQERDAPQRQRIRKVLQEAVELTGRTQTGDGGWGYAPNYWDDEGTLVVTQLQALRACRDAGIAVPKRIIDRGVDFIRVSANPDGSVRYRASSSEYRVRPGVTCAAVVALWNAGEYDSELIRRIASYMHRNIDPQWGYGHHAEYVQYYLSQAKFVLGGKEWLSFYKRTADMFLAEQQEEGYWEGADDGEIYGTVIALLCLQLPYNRLPVYQR